MSSTSFRKHLSMPMMLKKMRACFERIPDPITPRNLALLQILLSAVLVSEAAVDGGL